MQEADYLTRSAPVAIGSEKLGLDFSIGSCTDLFLYYLSAEDIHRFQRDGTWEQQYYYTKLDATGELDVLPVLLGKVRRDRSHIIGAEVAYGRPLPIECKADRNKTFYHADFALEELLGGSVAFPAEASGLARALGSNGQDSSPSQTRREAQQNLAFLVFPVVFLMLALIVSSTRYSIFSR